ncbi:hypothetical protein EHS25_002097 [Saitozyma podzolica]|uniref:Major facilitator superfamily (MFS) profile domain-containing protein n=1 Tax=Saitozyma podzolica TaxID=1890683 RepID=A0A427YEP4_9TREE|nr:hypothetical protein EHS25_002097 [Saitozyma podzolica]
MGLSEADLVDQSVRLSFARFITIFIVLELLLFLAFVDQFCVSTMTPYMAESLGAVDSITWVGTAAIITTIGSQMIVARCSDIFGRRAAFTAIVCSFIIGNVLCGFAQNAIWLFACRGLSGIGAGGIISLSMICVADLGYTGFMVALGSGMGPLIGAVMAARISWRWAFWITPPFLAACIPALWLVLPDRKTSPSISSPSKSSPSPWDDLRKVDFMGSFLILAASILILVAISGGGTLFSWYSASFGLLLGFGLASLTAFCLVERFFAPIPILPPRLFRHRTVNLILLATTTQGWIYYGLMFFVPLYLQEALGFSALMSGVLLLPQVFSQGLALGLAGWVASTTGYIVPQMQLGYALNLIGLGLMYRFDTETSTGYIVGVLLLVGFSTGLTLQTTLVTMQADGPEDLRAVVTGARNMFRSVGGAIGLVVASELLSAIRAAEASGFTIVFLTSLPLIAVSVLANVRLTTADSCKDGVSPGAATPSDVPAESPMDDLEEKR